MDWCGSYGCATLIFDCDEGGPRRLVGDFVSFMEHGLPRMTERDFGWLRIPVFVRPWHYPEEAEDAWQVFTGEHYVSMGLRELRDWVAAGRPVPAQSEP
jgi:hypothetical protein